MHKSRIRPNFPRKQPKRRRRILQSEARPDRTNRCERELPPEPINARGVLQPVGRPWMPVHLGEQLGLDEYHLTVLLFLVSVILLWICFGALTFIVFWGDSTDIHVLRRDRSSIHRL